MVPPDASEPAGPNKKGSMAHGHAERKNCIQCIHVDCVVKHSYANPPGLIPIFLVVLFDPICCLLISGLKRYDFDCHCR